MRVLDIVILLLLVLAIVCGARKGFVTQAVSLIALILGIYLAFALSSPLAVMLSRHSEAPLLLLRILSFAGIVIIVSLLCQLIEFVINKILKAVRLGGLNRAAGVFFSAAKMLLLTALFIALFDTINQKYELVNPDTLAGSRCYGPLKDVADTVFPYIKDLIWKG